MKFLLPHRFKKIGALLAPTGFALWLAMQLGYVKEVLAYFFGHPPSPLPWHHAVDVLAAVAGFFGFLCGLYFVTFSKEKVEDEMVQRTRLESFQFAAILQILLAIAGFAVMAAGFHPAEGALMVFFISLLLVFWISFIGRFNFILHVKLRA